MSLPNVHPSDPYWDDLGEDKQTNKMKSFKQRRAEEEAKEERARKVIYAIAFLSAPFWLWLWLTIFKGILENL